MTVIGVAAKRMQSSKGGGRKKSGATERKQQYFYTGCSSNPFLTLYVPPIAVVAQAAT
jgi:hypothetical protein